MNAPNAVPDGFKAFDRSSPFLDRLGPIWVNREAPHPRFAIRVVDHHLNNKGTVHGGVISTLADIACGYTLRWSTQPSPTLITVHLATEYLGAARPGDWLQATGTVLKRTRHLASSQATLQTEGGVVAHATALFHIRSDQGADPE